MAHVLHICDAGHFDCDIVVRTLNFSFGFEDLNLSYILDARLACTGFVDTHSML